jgi:WhiB family transcriptional regulator, redox-sensing transcriptional regulator
LCGGLHNVRLRSSAVTALWCRAEALDNKVEFGIWGGMTERQRRALLNEHPDIASWTDFFDKRNPRSVG